MNPEIEKEINYWLEQYLAANGYPNVGSVTYECGWIVMRSKSGGVTSRHRRSAFRNMAHVLRMRAERKVKP